MPPLGTENEIVAAERNDPRLRLSATQRGEPVGVYTGADNDPGRLDVADVRLDDGRPAAPCEPDNLAPEQQLASCGDHVLPERIGDAREVDDRRLRRVECPDARGVRLELAEPLRPDQLDARDAVHE